MQSIKSKGFTIIETMLFLAITGLLVTSIMVGMGVSINRQRYRDSVTSLQSFIQQQYSDVANVNNGRDSGWICDSLSGSVVQTSVNSGISRGKSDCVVLGRLIVVNPDGKSLSVNNIIGSSSPKSSSATNDVKAFTDYNMRISPVDTIKKDIEWGASLALPGKNSVPTLSILILQSPISGVIRTFVSSSSVINDSNIKSIININGLSEPAKMCINPTGLFSSARMAVVINAGASSSAGVETLGEASGC